MKVPTFKPVNRTDVPKAEEWIDDLRTGDVDQLKKVTQALQNQLSIADNFNAEVVTAEVRHNTWATVAIKTVRGKVWKVELASVDIPKTTDLNWLPLRWAPMDLEHIEIKLSFYVAGFIADPGYAVPVTLVVYGR